MSAGFEIQPEAFAFEAEPREFEAWQAEAPGAWQQEQNRGSADYIRWVQSALNQVLGLNLAVDGRVGPQTRSAVRRFQQKQGLMVDGVVGPATKAALDRALSGAGAPPTGAKKTADATLIQFDKNSTQLKDFHTPDIDRVADTVVESRKTGRPIFTIYVKGHASSEGQAQYNIGLGMGRALSVRRALQKAMERKGKNLSYKVLVLAQSKGENEPIASNDTEEGRSQNRRVEIFLSTKALAPIKKKIPPPQRKLICPPSNRPHICVEPKKFRYSSAEDPTPFSDSFLIQNAAPSSLNWSIEIEKSGASKRFPWILIAPIAGVFGEEAQRINLIVDPKDLPTGDHNATIRIIAPGADNSPQNVIVNLQVKPKVGIETGRRRFIASGIWQTGPIPEIVTATDIFDMKFRVKNMGIWPANVSITSNKGDTKKALLVPGASAELTFRNPGIRDWTFWVDNSVSIPLPEKEPKGSAETLIGWSLLSE